jgi:hypothetical protein
MDEQHVPDPIPASGPAVDQAPPEPPRRPHPRFSGLIGTGLALVVAFVWGGLAYRELGPKATRALPASVASTTRGTATAVRGSEAPPGWVSDLVTSFCRGDAKGVVDRVGPPLSGQADQIAQALSRPEWTCNDMRYIGGGTNPKGTFYVYVMTDKDNEEQWWVFTAVDDKVIAIE